MAEDSKKVRIGFVGVGSMGQCAHLRQYATLPDCEVVAIAELREKTGAAVARKYGVPKVYRSHEQMLASEKLDGLVAAQQFDRHGRLVPELLKAGLPVFTEKPLAASVAMGEKIVTALAASKTWMMVGYHKRSDPASEFARAKISQFKASGELGALKYVRLLMPAGDWIAGGFAGMIGCPEDQHPSIPADPAPSDMDAAAFKEYISFVNYYIHQVNLMRFLLGEPYQVTWADPSGVVLAGQSQSGVCCVLEMTPYRTTIDWQESAMVCFEKGYVKVELPAPLASNRPGRVTVFTDPGDGATPQTVEPQLPWVAAMRNQAMNFIAAIRGQRKPPCDAVEALEDLKVAREYLKLWKGR